MVINLKNFLPFINRKKLYLKEPKYFKNIINNVFSYFKGINVPEKL